MDRQEHVEFKIVHGCGRGRLLNLWRIGGHISIRLWPERYGWACLWIFWPTGRTFKEINDLTLEEVRD